MIASSPIVSDRNSHPSRALVIAGGGATGNAWAIGLIAGLADAGVDLTAADLVIGTSSGATAAAQITCADIADLYASMLSEPPAAARPGPARGISGQDYLDWSNAIIESAEDAAGMRRRMGAAAIERDATDGAAGARWRDIVARRLPRATWPDRRVLITALDARTGEPVVFDRDSGVDLVDAVAASTSAMNPYPIDDDRYLNGSYRRGENADLAAGCNRVVVLVPFGGRTRTPERLGLGLPLQLDELRASGSEVRTVYPDAAIAALFGADSLDPATRLPAARGGFAQGGVGADGLRDFWGGQRSQTGREGPAISL